MKNRYTKKQICEAIAFWKKRLKKLNESGEATNLSLDNVLSALEVFDACAMWPTAAAQLRMPKEAVVAISAAFEKSYGKIKAIGVSAVLSKQQYEDAIELYNNKPYEDYIEDEKYKLEASFSRDTLKQVFAPRELILLDGIEVDYKKCSAIAALYTI